MYASKIYQGSLLMWKLRRYLTIRSFEKLNVYRICYKQKRKLKVGFVQAHNNLFPFFSVEICGENLGFDM